MATYISLSDANTYFATRLRVTPWTNATLDYQQRALEQASRALSSLRYSGDKADEAQELEFPRDDDTEIPDAISYACAEEALSLLSGADPEMEYKKLFITSDGFGSVRSSYGGVPEHIVSGITSITAWRLLKPYLVDPQEIDINVDPYTEPD